MAEYKRGLTQDYSFEITGDMKYNPICACDNTGCARHGNCKACTEFHRLTNHPPTCRYAWHWKKGQKLEKL